MLCTYFSFRFFRMLSAYISAIAAASRRSNALQLGVSTRAAISLLRASQALALIRGRDFVTPDDVKALAKPVLGHRIVLGGMYGRTAKIDDVIAEVLSAVETPTESCERA